MKNATIVGIMGGGVMGKLIAQSIKKTFPSFSLVICERNPAHAKTLQKIYRAAVTTDVNDLAQADVVILAVKPQDFLPMEVVLKYNVLIISIMAGITTAAIRKFTHAKRIVRAMPNTPARFGKGFTAFYTTRNVSTPDIRFCSKLFDALGMSLQVGSEREINKVTAVSGSGPAYLLAMLAHFMNAAQSLGFSKKMAHTMIVQTLVGTVALLDHNSDPGELIKQIASKGGTTEAALHEFENAKLKEIWLRAVRAALQRAEELSKIK